MYRQCILVGETTVIKRELNTDGRILKSVLKKTRCQSADQIQTAPVNTATTIRVTWQRILMTSWATISSSRSLLHGYVIKIKNGCEEENVVSFTKYTWFEWFSKSIPTVSLNGINRLVLIVRNVFSLRGELKFYIYDLYKWLPNKIISSKKICEATFGT